VGQIMSKDKYLFFEAHSFPRAKLSENCSLLGIDNVRGQISEHIFAPSGGYCLLTKSDDREAGVRFVNHEFD